MDLLEGLIASAGLFLSVTSIVVALSKDMHDGQYVDKLNMRDFVFDYQAPQEVSVFRSVAGMWQSRELSFGRRKKEKKRNHRSITGRVASTQRKSTSPLPNSRSIPGAPMSRVQRFSARTTSSASS